MKHIVLCAFALSFSVAHYAEAEIVKETVEYEFEDSVFEGTLVYDNSAEAPNATVIIFHQWSGASEYELKRAHMLADEGYTAFVADIYSKGIRPASIPERKLQTQRFGSDRALTRARANAALEAIKDRPEVDADRIGAIGYCFGGMVALELARSGAPARAVSSIHGGLSSPTPEDAANIEGSILIQHGAVDPYVPQEELDGLKKEMSEAGVDFTVIEYADAVHAFTDRNAGDDPAKGAAYNEAADEKSWADLLAFLEAELQ